jgi:hypothetical protein
MSSDLDYDLDEDIDPEYYKRYIMRECKCFDYADNDANDS